jgi:hypothetical protein
MLFFVITMAALPGEQGYQTVQYKHWRIIWEKMQKDGFKSDAPLCKCDCKECVGDCKTMAVNELEFYNAQIRLLGEDWASSALAIVVWHKPSAGLITKCSSIDHCKDMIKQWSAIELSTFCPDVIDNHQQAISDMACVALYGHTSAVGEVKLMFCAYLKAFYERKISELKK